MELYQPYEEKILKLAAIKAKILKYKYLILACLFVLIAGISTLLYFKGTILTDLKLEKQYTYGDVIDYDASAFLSSVNIELQKDGREVDGITTPGSYKARAVANAAFGGNTYGKWQSFTLSPKIVSLSVADEVTYGENPSMTIDSLAFEDRLDKESLAVEFSNILGEYPKVAIKRGSFIIRNKEGKEVTSCYRFREDIYKQRDIEILRRSITLTTNGVDKVYDGMSTICEGYAITSGSLAYEDRLQIKGGYVRVDGADSVINAIDYAFINKEGKDVSALYSVWENFGRINVRPKPMTITTGDTWKLYDGRPCATPTYEAEGLIEGHRIVALGGNPAVESGTYQNSLIYDIKDRSGRSVKENYAITETWGELSIYAGRITVAVSGECVYMGAPITDFPLRITGGALQTGEQFIVKSVTAYDTFNREVTAQNVGRYRIKINEYEIQGRTEYAPLYYVELQEGWLTIVTRPITVRLVDKERYYNRLPFTSNETTSDNLVAGHYVVAESTGSITEPGAITNVLRTVIIKDASGLDVTGNYAITKQNGTLKVLKRKVTVYPLPITKTYDGTALQIPSAIPLQSRAYVDWTDANDPLRDGLALLSGDTLRINSVTLESTIVNVGTTHLIVSGSRILSQGGRDDTNRYYDVTVAKGTAEILPMTLLIRSLSHTKVYDGEALVGNSSDCYIAIGTLFRNESIQYTVTGSQTEVGICKNAITKVEIRYGGQIVGYAEYDGSGTLISGNGSTYNYHIEIECGTLAVSKDYG